jgi:hypothetical protein
MRDGADEAGRGPGDGRLGGHRPTDVGDDQSADPRRASRLARVLGGVVHRLVAVRPERPLDVLTVAAASVPVVTQTDDDRRFPVALAAALAVPFDYREGEGVDFEPYPDFEAAEDTAWWFRLWTGNPELDGSEFRVFGKDGAGGYAAFWLVRPGRPVAEQPVVFLGSEGETGVVARDLDDLLWLLAGGYGPAEAACPDGSGEWAARPDQELTAVAERFAPDRRSAPEAVIERAVQEFPDFEDTIMEMCR